MHAGDLLGTISSDLLGGHVVEVRSRYTGLVIVLHTFPCIDAHTSVAVVLEHPQASRDSFMRTSKIKAKLRNNEPVLLSTLHLPDPALFEMTSLLGWDGIWLDMEHRGVTLETAANLARAARVRALT